MVLIAQMVINYITDLAEQFPSPCGDYGSYLQKIHYVEEGETLWEFPSPCGDYGSYHQEANYEQLSIKVISVPLRGLWFLSAPFINGFMKPLKWHFAGRIIYFHHFSSFVRK